MSMVSLIYPWFDRAGQTVAEPEERTVSCQAAGLVGGNHSLHAVLGIGALLPGTLVEDIKAKKPARELQPTWVSESNAIDLLRDLCKRKAIQAGTSTQAGRMLFKKT